MNDSEAPPSPDPQIGKAAAMQAETGVQWLNFARDAFKVSNERQADLDALTKTVTQQQLGIANDQAGWARADRDRYETTFKPIEDEFIAEATNYASPERQGAAAAEAMADVGIASSAARQAAERNAASMGLDPRSGRHAGIERAGEAGTALATAGAANMARSTTRDKGLALKADVVNLGKGLPAQSASAASLGIGAGSSAVGLNQGTNAQYLASTNIMGQGYGGQMQGYSGQANTLSQQYSQQLAGWNAQQQASGANAAGLGAALGGIAGMFSFTSDENLKEDKEEVPEGDALDAVNNMPIEEWTYKDGVEDEGRHVGPYAQDFTEQTGTGDGKSIAVQDAIGITMKAVQDLSTKVDEIAGVVGLGKPKATVKAVKKPAPAAPPKAPRPPPAAIADMNSAPGLGARA